VSIFVSGGVMDRKETPDTVDGRNPAPADKYETCKSWDKLPTSTGVRFLPSTAVKHQGVLTTRLPQFSSKPDNMMREGRLKL